MTLEGCSPDCPKWDGSHRPGCQNDFLFVAIDRLVGATEDEKADLRFADWDYESITLSNLAEVVGQRLLTLRAEYAENNGPSDGDAWSGGFAENH